jgi:hypothetical protein
MFRKIACIAAVLSLQAGIVIALGGVADAGPVPLIGNVLCSSFVGHGKFNPGLTSSGSPGGVKITFSGKLTGCAGSPKLPTGAPVTIKKGIVTAGSGGFFTGATASKCGLFEGAAPADAVGTITMTVKWKTVPAMSVAPSVVTYNPGPYTAPTSATLNLEMGVVPGTPTTVTGSFAGSVVQDTMMDIPVPASAPCPVGPAFHFNLGKAQF